MSRVDWRGVEMLSTSLSAARELSGEETAELHRSNCKLNDHPMADKDPPPPKDPKTQTSGLSYKSKLTGEIPGAFEQFFYFERDELDVSDDDIDDDPEDNCPKVLLTRKEKFEIRRGLSSSIIVKLLGKNLEYHFFRQKLLNLWKPKGGMDCVDLGYGYHIVTFHCSDDLSRIFREGPWFINQQFLSVRMWEPNFQPSEASVSTAAVWIRIPQLSYEYYTLPILKKIGSAIGPLLKIDKFTANGERGKFARLCVQLDLSKPLPDHVSIGPLKPKIHFEGLSSLCMSCGMVGHKSENCGKSVSPRPMENSPDKHTSSQDLRHDHPRVPESSPWILVQKRRKNPPSKAPSSSQPRRPESSPITGNSSVPKRDVEPSMVSTPMESTGAPPMGPEKYSQRKRGAHIFTRPTSEKAQKILAEPSSSDVTHAFAFVGKLKTIEDLAPEIPNSVMSPISDKVSTIDSHREVQNDLGGSRVESLLADKGPKADNSKNQERNINSRDEDMIREESRDLSLHSSNTHGREKSARQTRGRGAHGRNSTEHESSLEPSRSRSRTPPPSYRSNQPNPNSCRIKDVERFEDISGAGGSHSQLRRRNIPIPLDENNCGGDEICSTGIIRKPSQINFTSGQTSGESPAQGVEIPTNGISSPRESS